MNNATLSTASTEAGFPSSPSSLPGQDGSFIIAPDDQILVTGAAGFIGSRVVGSLFERGFRNLVCFGRPSGKLASLTEIANEYEGAQMRLITGNLLSRRDC